MAHNISIYDAGYRTTIDDICRHNGICSSEDTEHLENHFEINIPIISNQYGQ